MLRIRQLAMTDLTALPYDEPSPNRDEELQGESSPWTQEILLEVHYGHVRRLVRIWFEAQGHGYAEIDHTTEHPGRFLAHFQAATAGQWAMAAVMLGIVPDRRWVEITSDIVRQMREGAFLPD